MDAWVVFAAQQNPLTGSTSDLSKMEMHSSESGELTRLLKDGSKDPHQAAEELLPLVYEELRHLAAARMAQESAGQTLQATALVHEAWVRLTGGRDQKWANRAHFFAAAAEAMRRVLIENARKKSRLKHGGHLIRANLAEMDIPEALTDDTLLLMDEALARLRAVDSEKGKIVVMKFFGGLTNQQVAEHLGVAERTVERQWAFAKAWLFEEMRRQS